VSGALDLKRIAELSSLIGSDLEAMLSSLVKSMARSIEELEGAIAGADLEGATQAAHRCRNDALVVGARHLQAALSTVEAHSRDLRLEPAREALDQVREAWPLTRQELERAAREAPPA
jgi:HPt (histidine-containing phosphotransfer) domain-containing protein